jgi:hypothetical protein
MAPRIFRTTDIHLSAALKLNDFKLLGIEKDPRSRRGIFSFEDKPDRPKLIQAFYEGSLEGSLKRYVSIWSDLKSLVNQMQLDCEPERMGDHGKAGE